MNITKFSTLIIILSVFAASCVKDQYKEVEPAYSEEYDGSELNSVEFQIADLLDDEGDGPATKSTLTSVGFVWAEKDTVGIFPSKGNQIYYEMSGGAGSSSASFDGGGWALKQDHSYWSYYPLRGDFYLNRKAIPVEYPSVVCQNGNNNSDHLGPNAFMYTSASTVTSGTLNFKYWQIGSVLKPRVTLPAGNYTKLVLSTDSPIFVVSGTYDITTAAEDNPNTTENEKHVPVVVPVKDKHGVDMLTNELTIELENVVFTQETELIAYIMSAPVDVSNIPITVTIFADDEPKYRYEFVRATSFVAQTNHNIRPNEKGLMNVANSAASANEAFANGVTSLTLFDIPAGTELDLTLPSTSEPVNISASVSDDPYTINVSYPEGATNVPSEISVQAPTGSNLVLATPQSTVSIDGEHFNSVRAATASNTLIVPENVTVGTLYLEKGNVTVYGTIQALNTDDLMEGEHPIITVYGSIEGQIDDEVTVVIPAKGITLDRTSLDLEAGDEIQLTATLDPIQSTSPIAWSSSDQTVATVSSTGLVTAVSSGDCVITASVDNSFKATCDVTVSSSDDRPFTVTSVGGSTVSFATVGNGNPPAITLEYRVGKNAWSAYSVGSEIALSDGEQLQFRAGESGNENFSSYAYYNFKASGNVTVSGNIMSLLDRTLQREDLPEKAFYSLFDGCKGLVDASGLILPVMTLSSECYEYMFSGCSAMTGAPELPATTLAPSCYKGMFGGTALAKSPALPAMKLADYCYQNMFSGCTALTEAPVLPATTLASYCYAAMFMGCTGLTESPALPANRMATGCYNGMFKNCSNLVTAPELHSTQLAVACYVSMFSHCTALTEAPALPAMTLADQCYTSMFEYCYGLTESPVLPATTLVTGCYANMFSYCRNLSRVTALFVALPYSSYTSGWLSGVASNGTFVKSQDAVWNVSGTGGVPDGWTIHLLDADGNEVVPKLYHNGHEYVDLGITSNGKKLYWATTNIGAESADSFGDYFAWGEVTGKSYAY